MSQTTVEANAITSQPLMANMPNLMVSPDAAADVVTSQPLLTEPNEEIKKKREDIEIDDDDCTWCCITCLDCTNGCDLGLVECCSDCCNECGDCCTGCCEGGLSGDGGNIDGGDVAGCLECCGSCFECCSD